LEPVITIWGIWDIPCTWSSNESWEENIQTPSAGTMCRFQSGEIMDLARWAKRLAAIGEQNLQLEHAGAILKRFRI